MDKICNGFGECVAFIFTGLFKFFFVFCQLFIEGFVSCFKCGSKIKKASGKRETKQEKKEQYLNINKKSSKEEEKIYSPRKYEKGVLDTNVCVLNYRNKSNENEEKIIPVENISIKKNKEKEKEKKPCRETERENKILETIEKLNEDSEKNVEKEKKIVSDINRQAFINKI